MARIAVLGACAAVVLSACNAILGMEHARLDEGVSSGTGGTPGAQFVPPRGSALLAAAQKRACSQGANAACVDCLQNCTGYDECLSNGDCRGSIDGYAYCLGKTCSVDAEECLFGLDSPIKTCLNSCKKDCVKSTVASPCELYCGCMDEFCVTYLKGGSCVEECESWPLEVQLCRRGHCEYASDGIGADGVDHCLHANGDRDVCNGVAPVQEPRDAACLGLQLSGWACKSQNECCSKTCLDGKCK